MTGVDPIGVRHTAAADWALLKGLRLAALRDAPTAFGVSHAQALADPDSDWQRRAAGTGPSTFFLAFEHDEAIGMAAAVAVDDRRMGLIAMWVSPPARGRQAGAGGGVADRLVDAVKARAADAGASELILEVAPSNRRAVALYARHGFVFQSHVEYLASHPHIALRRMAWPVE
ncbi:GNAT family N-acetyltransferase [Massilia sp. DWR3-1-1]|uniref:GNAT family N-acetyltransferase n=1 Tax=Massilia sp. DWR3-1-1 TaxID=2804559 RepID=UPI003CE96311